MSAILLATRKKTLPEKKKYQIRKAGLEAGSLNLGQETASWKVLINGKKTKICFSRDTCNVLVDDVCVDADAYIKDQDYDLDLFFEVEGHKCHIISDVEGTTMTNELYFDDVLHDRNVIKDCKSKHRPELNTE